MGVEEPIPKRGWGGGLPGRSVPWWCTIKGVKVLSWVPSLGLGPCTYLQKSTEKKKVISQFTNFHLKSEPVESNLVLYLYNTNTNFPLK